MDYSKHGIDEKKRQISSGTVRAKKKAGFTIFRLVIICIIFVVVVGIAALVGGFKGIIDSAPELDISEIAPTSFKSYIYSIDGELEHEIVGEESNRIYVTIDEISENVQNAFIALEDERFLTHNGIDPEGIIRALFVGIANGGDFTEGASTITQQLIKLSVFDGGNESNQLQRFRRKFQEQYLALQLEEELTKDEILEAYLNTINLGNSCYGVEAAANYYFDKSASELTVSEAAVLAAIAQSPTNNNPVDNPTVNNERREITINYMYEQGMIDEETRDEALADTDIYDQIAINAANYASESAEVYTYYEEEAIYQVLEDLQEELGYTEEEAEDLVYSGAIKIYLAQDTEIQQICDSYYSDDSNFPMTEYLLEYALSVYTNPDDEDDDETVNYSTDDLVDYLGLEYALFSTEEEAEAAVEEFKAELGLTDDSKYVESISISPQIQSTFVVIDQSTGYVAALVGGRGEKTINFGYDRATMSTRQPGSAFKIVSTYAPAIDACGDTLETTKIDENVETVSGHVIENSNDKETLEEMTFYDAIVQSKNTVAVRTLQEDVGTDLALEYLTENFHFTTIDLVNDAVDVLAIGGITNGVTNLELTAAYASIANEGQYIEPVFYSKVLDSEGNVLLENSADEPETSTAIKATTAYLLTQAMIGVVEDSSGTAYGKITVSDMTIAGKTGTTDEYVDTWFVGYSPYYTAGIWFGYDNNISPTTRSGWATSWHEYLWSDIMNAIVAIKDEEDIGFDLPDGVEYVDICTRTGLLASDKCESESTLMDSDEVPTETCDECDPVLVCGVCGGIATDYSSDTYYEYDDIPSYYCTCEPETEAQTEATEASEEEEEASEDQEEDEEADDSTEGTDSGDDTDTSTDGSTSNDTTTEGSDSTGDGATTEGADDGTTQ